MTAVALYNNIPQLQHTCLEFEEEEKHVSISDSDEYDTDLEDLVPVKGNRFRCSSLYRM